MSEQASTNRSFRLALIITFCLIAVPAFLTGVLLLTFQDVDRLPGPLQPVFSLTLLLGILSWILSPPVALIAFFAAGTRAAAGIVAGFWAGTIVGIAMFALFFLVESSRGQFQ